jgi:hypothetical protein
MGTATGHRIGGTADLALIEDGAVQRRRYGAMGGASIFGNDVAACAGRH